MSGCRCTRSRRSSRRRAFPGASLSRNLAAAHINPLEHYEQFGWTEGRDPRPSFDTLGYLAANPDVAAAHINPLDHFLAFGIYEGRQPAGDGVWH